MALKLMNRTDNMFTFIRNEHLAGRSPNKYNPRAKGQNADPTYDTVCKTVYEQHVVSLDLEIGKSSVQEIVKDIKVTFPDMLGTIGKN